MNKRAPNFSTKEEEELLKLVAKYSSVLENKRTDNFTSKLKQEHWEKVTYEFNMIPFCQVRGMDNLKVKYENMKKMAKRKHAENNGTLTAVKRNCQQQDTHPSLKQYDEMSFVGEASNPLVVIKEEFNSSPSVLDIHNSSEYPNWQNDDNVTRNSPPSAHSEYSEDDDDLHFFKSILPDLKGLPRSKKVQFRMKILQLVHSELYQNEDIKEKT